MEHEDAADPERAAAEHGMLCHIRVGSCHESNHACIHTCMHTKASCSLFAQAALTLIPRHPPLHFPRPVLVPAANTRKRGGVLDGHHFSVLVRHTLVRSTAVTHSFTAIFTHSLTQFVTSLELRRCAWTLETVTTPVVACGVAIVSDRMNE